HGANEIIDELVLRLVGLAPVELALLVLDVAVERCRGDVDELGRHLLCSFPVVTRDRYPPRRSITCIHPSPARCSQRWMAGWDAASEGITRWATLTRVPSSTSSRVTLVSINTSSGQSGNMGCRRGRPCSSTTPMANTRRSSGTTSLNVPLR